MGWTVVITQALVSNGARVYITGRREEVVGTLPSHFALIESLTREQNMSLALRHNLQVD